MGRDNDRRPSSKPAEADVERQPRQCHTERRQHRHAAGPHLDGAEAGQRRGGGLHLGFGRIVASEIAAPNMLANLV